MGDNKRVGPDRLVQYAVEAQKEGGEDNRHQRDEDDLPDLRLCGLRRLRRAARGRWRSGPWYALRCIGHHCLTSNIFSWALPGICSAAAVTLAGATSPPDMICSCHPGSPARKVRLRGEFYSCY